MGVGLTIFYGGAVPIKCDNSKRSGERACFGLHNSNYTSDLSASQPFQCRGECGILFVSSSRVFPTYFSGASTMADIETIGSLAKRRGFVFQSSDVYGGLGSVWDYGPLGIELKNNIKRAWWRALVYERDDIVGLDAGILMNRLVWKYSGHEETFSDPLVDCRKCKTRLRADKIEGGKCPSCGSTDLTEPRQFNLMFRTTVGPVEDESGLTYLRPETAQGIFVNFKNVLDSTNKKLPFGIAQVGKSFRNEITPGNFIFRTREFEQMEMEFFVRPPQIVKSGELTDEDWHERWIAERFNWYLGLGMREDDLRKYEQPKEELAHYAKRTVDIQYRFFPDRADPEKQWDELEGIANRRDFDLQAHSKKPVNDDGKRKNPDSTADLTYFDQESNQHVFPYVIEPAVGVDRSLLAFLMNAYHEEEVRGEKRVVLKLQRDPPPITEAVLPLASTK